MDLPSNEEIKAKWRERQTQIEAEYNAAGYMRVGDKYVQDPNFQTPQEAETKNLQTTKLKQDVQAGDKEMAGLGEDEISTYAESIMDQTIGITNIPAKDRLSVLQKIKNMKRDPNYIKGLIDEARTGGVDDETIKSNLVAEQGYNANAFAQALTIGAGTPTPAPTGTGVQMPSAREAGQIVRTAAHYASPVYAGYKGVQAGVKAIKPKVPAIKKGFSDFWKGLTGK